jgi:repressor LexA
MYSDLSNRQISILNFIKKELRKKGYPPSVREIGAAVGLRSSSTVHGHLSTLEEKGYIRRDPTKPRAIEVLAGNSNFVRKEIIDVPIVGKVTAGQPILAVENIDDTFPLPMDFVNNDNVFILSVRGESMINAGILDNDYVLVRQQPNAKNGDIVVAMIEDEATVKTFYKEKDYIRLQPENDSFEPIYSTNVTILGKVIGVFRRIH